MTSAPHWAEPYQSTNRLKVTRLFTPITIMAAQSNGNSATEDFMTLSVEDDEADEFEFVPEHPAWTAPPSASSHHHRSKSERSHHRKKHTKGKSPRKKERLAATIPLPPAMEEDGPLPLAVEEDGVFVEELPKAIESSPPRTQPERQPNCPLESLTDLYRSLNMDLESSAKRSKYQLNTLHIRGTDQMTAKDVAELFDEHAPLRADWISGTSCNVIFKDAATAGLAMLAASQPFRAVAKSQDSEADDDMSGHRRSTDRHKTVRQYPVELDSDTGEEIYVCDLASFPLPVPKGSWRVARTVPRKAKQLLFRFAQITDKTSKSDDVDPRSLAFEGGAVAVVKIRSAPAEDVAAALRTMKRTVLIAEPKEKTHISERLGKKPETNGRNGTVNHPVPVGRSLKVQLEVLSQRPRTPYERSTNRTTTTMTEGRLPLATPSTKLPIRPLATSLTKPLIRPGDLRYMLQHKEEALPISADDLRHRITHSTTQPLVAPPPAKGNVHSRLGRAGEPDLRNRLNLVRRMGPIP
ncbi:hypothetical protein BV898_11151 [Hypsibius exemplaris]|uniref:Nuclear cap-binding protein subunit 3 n=1 Tax=Hypsibius exemplaris TaxID=2072580 RepID=A0A1W0WHG3_HYPEX|nr:hypothetical protein BV898_11151 [Hypsibius exemplaris]